MRNQWRLLLRHHRRTYTYRSVSLIHQQVPTTPSYPSSSSRYLSSLFPYNTSLNLAITSPSNLLSNRHFSTAPPDDQKTSDYAVLIVDIFSKPISDDEIQKELESRNIVISHDLVLSALENMKSNPSAATRLFGWVLERESERLSSKSYNLMLKNLGNNGFIKEFWDMVYEMKKKGYGVSKGTFIEASKKFEEDGLQADLEKLKGLFSKELDETTASCRVSKIVRKGVWDEGVEKEIRELGISSSSNLVKMVLEKLNAEPLKGLIFFRWVEESGFFKHDGVTYNAMAVVLGREDCIDRFWNVVDEMRNLRHEMERENYLTILPRFIKRKMLKDAVTLYEFVMSGKDKLPKEECVFLLKKIAASKELDMDLFFRVVRSFTENGFSLEDSMLDAALKSLTSVGRMSDYNRIIQAMMECGFRPSAPMQARVAFDLCSSRMQDEADEFVQKLEVFGLVPDHKMWVSLIEGYCVTGNFEKAKDGLQNMVDKEGISSAGYPLDMLVNAYCHSHKAVEACKVLSHFVNKQGIKPLHMTYKILVSKLLLQKQFHDALSLLNLMKNHGFPPFLDPFIKYLSTKGTANEAMQFLKGMTVNRFPAISIFLCIFEAFSDAGRHSEAQSLLAKCPQFIRTNADVLNLFYSMQSEKSEAAATLAVQSL